MTTDHTPPAEQDAPSPDKIVSEHVTTLHLIGEQLAQVELWMWEHLADVRRATAMQQAAPADWIDGHPQLEVIAAAVWEQCGRSDSGMCVEDDPRNIAVAALAAVLPPPVSRADAPAAECSAQNRNYEAGPRLCIRAAQHRGDHIDERGFHWSDTVAVYPLGDGTFRTGVNRGELRRMADEAQPDETVHTCPGRWGGPHCCCFDTDEAQPGTEAASCSVPNPCEDGEPCAIHEKEQAHAEGEHAFCGDECTEAAS